MCRIRMVCSVLSGTFPFRSSDVRFCSLIRGSSHEDGSLSGGEPLAVLFRIKSCGDASFEVGNKDKEQEG